MNDLDTAQAELDQVLKNAPENLAAIRGVAEIHHRRGELGEALAFYKAALGLAKHDPDLEQTVDEISRALSTPWSTMACRSNRRARSSWRRWRVCPAASKRRWRRSRRSTFATHLAPLRTDAPSHPQHPPALPELERFLEAIHTNRQKKAV